MKDYIVFRVADNHYALDVAFVERIIQPLHVTAIPYSHPYVEGMVSYEKKVTKVLSFRKLTGLSGYEEELMELFARAASGYAEWTQKLESVLEGENDFALSGDSRITAFGEWLETFSSHDAEVMALVKKLRPLQARLIEGGKEALWAKQSDPLKADALFAECTQTILPQIMEQMEGLMRHAKRMAEHLQKMIIYRDGEEFFAIKVDTIEDMAQIDSDMLLQVEEVSRMAPFLEMEGVVEREGSLVNVIKTVVLPVREAA